VATPPLAFYSVSASQYFLGAVGMLNSLRLVGHREPVYILDWGLTDVQRRLLEPHATLVPAPEDAPPWLLKTIAPLRHPAEVMVLIDADIIVTRPLTELIEHAGEGKVVAFRTAYDRFFPAWGQLLALGPVRRLPYLCSALVFLGGAVGDEVLGLVDEGQARLPAPQSGRSGGRREFFQTAASSPLALLDQDVLNAVLASRVASDRIVALDHRLAPEPPFPGLRLIAERDLRCAYDGGAEPYGLHHLGPKPWIAPVRENLYSRLLVRLLVGPGIALRVPEGELPLRLRDGLLAGAGRRLAGAQDRLRSSVWEPLSWRVGARVDALRSRLASGTGSSEGGP
jgi:hypothetical protein